VSRSLTTPLSFPNLKVNRASWVQENFITDDTEAISALILIVQPLLQRSERCNPLRSG